MKKNKFRVSAGGWKNIKTKMIYKRKAGIDIQGATDSLDFGCNIKAQKQEMFYLENLS